MPCHSLKCLQVTNAGEDVEKREPSYPTGGNVNWCSFYREQYGISSVTKNRTTMRSSNPTPGHVSGQNSNSNRCMHAYVHSNTIHNSQDKETTETSIARRITKVCCIYTTK